MADSTNELHELIDLRVYRLTAVQKTAYRLASRCTAVLGAVQEKQLAITLLFKPFTDSDAIAATRRAFFQELLDQELREKIAEKTDPMRALLLAHAFSKTDLIRRE